MRHETSIIRGNVTIGERVVIEPYAVITGPCVIEDDAYIGAHATIGAPGQHRSTYPSPISATNRALGGVRVGRGACVREYATIHQGLVAETVVGADALLMAGCHVAHDCQLGSGVTLGSFSVLGGFTLVDDEVTFGQGVITHPWVLVGEGAMVGLNSSVVKDVLPYAKVAGAPARLLGANTHKNPLLSPDYDEAVLSEDVWTGWGALVDARDILRRRFSDAHGWLMPA